MPHLYPTGEGFVHDYPTAEIDVDEKTAKTLLAYHPPVYSLKPTGWPPAPDAEPKSEAPETPGPSDSKPKR